AVFGHGAYYSSTVETWLYADTLPHAQAGTRYELSVWLYAEKRTAGFPELSVSQNDSSDKAVTSGTVYGKFSTCTYGNWVRVQYEFTLTNTKNKLYVVAGGANGTYDEFMIRPVNENVLAGWGKDSVFTFNNYPLR